MQVEMHNLRIKRVVHFICAQPGYHYGCCHSFHFYRSKASDELLTNFDFTVNVYWYAELEVVYGYCLRRINVDRCFIIAHHYLLDLDF